MKEYVYTVYVHSGNYTHGDFMKKSYKINAFVYTNFMFHVFVHD